MNADSSESEPNWARISEDVNDASAAVEAGDLDATEARLKEALRTVRESKEQVVGPWIDDDVGSWNDDDLPTGGFHDGTGSNFQPGTGEQRD